MIFEKIRKRLQEKREIARLDFRGYSMGIWEDAIDIINQVEAEYKEEYKSKCAECTRRKFYMMGYQAAKENNGWIPCEVELPKVSTSYLVTEEVIINSEKLYVVDIRLFGTEDEWLCPSNRKIIAWQPLPQPPKGE